LGFNLALVVLDQYTDRAELDLLAGLVPMLDLAYRLVSGGLVFRKMRLSVVFFAISESPS
jgi:hypothetical protein